LTAITKVNSLKKTKRLLVFLKPDKNQTKKSANLKHLVFLQRSVNRVGETQKTKQNRGRKQSVQKNKCFVWFNAGKKSSVNTPSGGHEFESPVWRELSELTEV
jgi:hypothetical protein